ncbi:6-bladed beta-propeller [Roseivirga echinicomitans]
MNSINKILIPITFLTLLISCNKWSENENNKNTSAISLSLEQTESSQFSEVIDTIRYITLKSENSSRAFQIDKVLISNQSIYIFDYYAGQTLEVYDLFGNYKFHISNQGSGPDQYSEVQDFLIDNGNIEILDSNGKILFFDKNGQFNKSIKLPFLSTNFFKIGEQYFFKTEKLENSLAKDGSSCALLKYNIDNGEKSCIIKKNNTRKPHSFRERAPMSNGNKGVLYSSYFNDTIFSISNTEVKPRFILKTDDKSLPSELFSFKTSHSYFIDYLNNNKDKIYHTPHLLQSDKFLITMFRENGDNYLIYNLHDQTWKILKGAEQNNFDGGFPLHWAHTLVNDEIVSVVDPNYLIENLNKLEAKNDIKSPNEIRFMEFARTLKQNDPNVIIFYRLK